MFPAESAARSAGVLTEVVTTVGKSPNNSAIGDSQSACSIAFSVALNPLWKRWDLVGQFRSCELDPSALLRVPPFGESNIGVWLERKRESYQSAINAINANRSALVRDRNIKVADPAVAKLKGRLLLYEPMETVTDGASDSSSRGFFDIEDAPPWDTWFLYSEGSIFSWVPEALVQDAQAGIDANPVDCIHWYDWPRL